MRQAEDTVLPYWVWELRHRAHTVETQVDYMKEIVLTKYTAYEGSMPDDILDIVVEELEVQDGSGNAVVALQLKGYCALFAWKCVRIVQAYLAGELTKLQASTVISQL